MEDRIQLTYEGDGILAQALERWHDFIATEVLAVSIRRGHSVDGAAVEILRVEQQELSVSVARVAHSA